MAFSAISGIPERVLLGFMFGIVMNFHWESWERFNIFVLDSAFSLDFLFCVVCIRISRVMCHPNYPKLHKGDSDQLANT